MPVDILVAATDATFDEERYLQANPDVRNALAAGFFTSGRTHFEQFGRRERRRMVVPHALEAHRAAKMERLRAFLRTDIDSTWRDGKVDYLSAELRSSSGIRDGEEASSNDYGGEVEALIARHEDGLVLDCGAGFRQTYYENVVNFEIADYASTDVLGVGEELPFLDDTFDAVISIAVLEHVRDPFRCAQEIARVLRPGGELFCSVPFLQPYHGYPHHYFNATAQGIRRLFEDRLEVEDVRTNDATHPIFSLHWIVDSWAAGLSGGALKTFEAMTVAELRAAPAGFVGQPFCRELSPAKLLELASATILTARKPS